MFSIKHISIRGHEEIHAADHVRYDPECGSTGPDGGTRGLVYLGMSGRDEDKPLHGGTVFVMNAVGKTVARYDLGASPVPIVGDGLSDPRPKGIGGQLGGFTEDKFPVRAA